MTLRETYKNIIETTKDIGGLVKAVAGFGVAIGSIPYSAYRIVKNNKTGTRSDRIKRYFD